MRSVLSCAMALALALAPGCAANPEPGEPGYPRNLEGAYESTFAVMGTDYSGTTSFRTEPGGRVRGEFVVEEPISMEGELTGTISRDSLSFSGSYTQDQGCEGTVSGRGVVSADGSRVAGPLEIEDSCGGLLEGTFQFERAGGTASTPTGSERPSGPGDARLVVDDLRRLAEALESLESGGDTLAVLANDYLAAGSSGLRTYAGRYDVTPRSLRSAIERHGLTAERIDGLAEAILALEAGFREGFRRLEDLYPDATFPPVWFVGGDMGAGGMNAGAGVILAAERFLDRPADMVPIALHELAHYQQWNLQGLGTYLEIYDPDRTTLLALALREGSADLIAELTTGRHSVPAAERYGLEHEAELWEEFREDLDDADPGEWMFRRPPDPDRPQDLGYWMGYRIAESYFENAEDEQEAVREILSLTDFEAFLEKSGYADRWETTREEPTLEPTAGPR